MTLVVGLQYEGDIWLGGDRLSGNSDSYECVTASHSKIWKRYEWLIGGCASWRVMQLIEHRIHEGEKGRTQTYGDNIGGVMEFAESCRKTLKKHGALHTENGLDRMRDHAALLIGVRGAGLFTLYSDFTVSQSEHGYHAIGAGSSQALGALHVISETDSSSPAGKVMRALKAAEIHSMGVRGPFDIITTVKDEL